MNRNTTRIARFAPSRRTLLAAALATTALLAACGGGGNDAVSGVTQQLYTQTGETVNRVVHFSRQADGTLVRKEAELTGGTGTNAIRANGTPGPNSLGSQYSVIMSADRQFVFLANGGDASISVLGVDQGSGALTLKKATRTTGVTPNSLAFSNGFLYSTFLRGTNQLAAYKLEGDGSLAQVGLYNIAAATGLSATAIAPTQVVVSPDGKWLVVSSGTGSNAVITYAINANGTLGTPIVNNTQFATPFAGGFVPGTSTPVYLSTGITGVSLTSYTLAANGTLARLNEAAATGVGAPCWLSIAPNGKFAFVGNGSGSITSYSIAANGAVTLLRSIAAEEPSVLTGVSSVAGDSWISPDSKFLYSTYLGADKVVVYSIGADGTLTKLGENAIGTSTHLSMQGLFGA